MDITNIPLAIALSFIAVGILEFFLSWRWNKIYFSVGLPVFSAQVLVPSTQIIIPPTDLLESHFRSKWITSIIFRQIGLNLYGFREEIRLFRKSGSFQYLILMRGKLLFDPKKKQVVVKGFVNWTTLFMLLLCLALLIYIASQIWYAIIMLLLFLFSIGYSYAHQADQFTEVMKFSARSWSKDISGA